jgi:hypothetical protein
VHGLTTCDALAWLQDQLTQTANRAKDESRLRKCYRAFQRQNEIYLRELSTLTELDYSFINKLKKETENKAL